MEFSTYLTEARGKAGLSRRELARRVEVSNQYLRNIEIGEVLPSLSLCGRLAVHLGLDSEILMMKAGHVPPNILELMQAFPIESCAIIRRLAKVSAS